MDIRKYNLDGEWITFEVDTKIPLEPLKFKVQPIGTTDVEAAHRSMEEITRLCSIAVIDWDLTDGDHPLKCTAENKKKYLSKLLIFKVRTMNGEGPKRKIKTTDPETGETTEREEKWDTNIAWAMLEFAAEPDNFLKN